MNMNKNGIRDQTVHKTATERPRDREKHKGVEKSGLTKQLSIGEFDIYEKCITTKLRGNVTQIVNFRFSVIDHIFDVDAKI